MHIEDEEPTVRRQPVEMSGQRGIEVVVDTQ
jgi:hypothetical protein